MEKKFQEELGHDIKKHHKTETIIAFTVLGVIAVAMGVGAWWYMATLPTYDATPTTTVVTKTTGSSATSTDETSEWKTYTNDVFDFTMKYPETWVLSDKLQTVKTDPGAANKALTFTNGTKYGLTVWINPDGFGYEDVSNTYSYEGSTVVAKKIVLGTKNVSSNPAGDGSFMVTTTVTNGADRYIFSMMGDNSTDIVAADDYFTKMIAALRWL